MPFPPITLIVAIFLVLQMVGLYNSLVGVILVKAAIDMPLGIWIMKGFYDTVPWEIEMAGIQDGARRFRVWRRLVLPQVRPGLFALGLFSFLLGVERIHPAPGSGAGQPGAGAVGLPRVADRRSTTISTWRSSKSVGPVLHRAGADPVLRLPELSHEHLRRGDEGLMRILLDGFHQELRRRQLSSKT